jgi:AraC-like DNA-binding protein
MKVSRPLDVALPAGGVLFAESIHASDFRMPERTDPFHKLVYVFRGHAAFPMAESVRPIEAPEGTMLVIGAGQPHRLEDRAPTTLLLLCLGAEWLEAEPERMALWARLARERSPAMVLDRPARSQCESAWRRAMAEQIRTRAGGGLLVRSLADQTLVLLARRPTASGAGALDRVRTVLREIEDSFFEEWSLDRAANRAGLSRRRFSDIFRSEAGTSFVEHLTARRLSHARELLEQGGNSVLGVMFSCGFNDLSHFYRLYRRRFGETPGSRRRAGGH